MLRDLGIFLKLSNCRLTDLIQCLKRPRPPDRVQSVVEVEETPPPAKKVSLPETLANMITSLANRKTRSIEVSRGHNEETQAVIFPPRTRTVQSFLNQASRSGWIDDITPEPHHRRGMLMTLMMLQVKRET